MLVAHLHIILVWKNRAAEMTPTAFNVSKRMDNVRETDKNANRVVIAWVS